MSRAILQQALDALKEDSFGRSDKVYYAKLALENELAKPEPVPEAWRSWHDTYGVGYWDTFDEAELNCTEDAEPTELFTKEQL